PFPQQPQLESPTTYPRLAIENPRNNSLQVYKTDDRFENNNPSTKGSACYMCKKTGHWASRCPSRQPTQSGQSLPFSGQEVILKGRLFHKQSNDKRSFPPTNPFANKSKQKVHLINDASTTDTTPIDSASAIAETTDGSYELWLQALEAEQLQIED
ncbi:hypothetical protein K3495_g17320, partial [Podosphaera aphanis]